MKDFEEITEDLSFSERFGVVGDGQVMLLDGRMVNIFEPKPEDIDIEIIAHNLSNINRFNGSVRYNVAHHSVIVSKQVPRTQSRAGLLHDAQEAILGDMIRPLKVLVQFGLYRDLETIWQRFIFKHFGLDPTMPRAVKLADNRLLMTEFRDLFPKLPEGLPEDLEPYPFTIRPLSSQDSEVLFMDRFRELTRG